MTNVCSTVEELDGIRTSKATVSEQINGGIENKHDLLDSNADTFQGLHSAMLCRFLSISMECLNVPKRSSNAYWGTTKATIKT